MENEIEVMVGYEAKLDEVYAKESLTADLDSESDLVTLVGGSFKVPKMSMDGLANHDRSNGGVYVDGGASLSFETKTPDYDRNRKFTIDAMDDKETSGIAFGKLSGEFIRTKVVPEIDAVRFAKYAKVAGTVKAGTIADAKAFLELLRGATTQMDEDEVPEENRYLYAIPSLINSVMALQTIESREVLAKFKKITKVPSGRFYNDVDLLDGKSEGQEKGGFKASAVTYALTTDKEIQTNKVYYTRSGSEGAYKYTAVTSPVVGSIGNYYEAKGGIPLNFLIVAKGANIQALKHVAPKHIPSALNQNADGDSYAYRVYGINDFYDNKVKGIYSHRQY